MNILGLITEYNPFHNGHSYHIEKSKKITDSEFSIVVMSGDFVQRGAPALIDKFTRTRMALSSGADLVLELPVGYACGSAEFFALGAVSILNSLGIVDYLCFGSEWGDMKELEQVADVLTLETADFSAHLQNKLRQGETFPAARASALKTQLPHLPAALLESPNNILGIEYIKALKKLHSRITPVTIERINNSYHSTALDGKHISSATALRQKLLAGDSHSLKGHIPPAAWEILDSDISANGILTSQDFSLPLHSKLLGKSIQELTKYQDISPDLARRIRNLLPQYEDLEQFVQLLKTRQFTETRIRRCLFHVLLEIRSSDFHTLSVEKQPSYLRVLGFRKNASSLLGEIQKNSPVPLITRLADARDTLPPEVFSLVEKDLHASALYHAVRTSKYHAGPYDEYTLPLIVK